MNIMIFTDQTLHSRQVFSFISLFILQREFLAIDLNILITSIYTKITLLNFTTMKFDHHCCE